MTAGARILVIRLGGVGDVVFTLPAVQAIRAAFPDSRLTFLTYREFTPLLSGFGNIETVLSVDRAAYKTLNPQIVVGETLRLITRLGRARFSLAVDFQGFGETAWLTWFTRAPLRWGSVYRAGRGWAYTHPVRRNHDLHPIEYNLELLRQAGGVKPEPSAGAFVVPEAALRQACCWFGEHGLDPEQPTLLLHPMTSTAEKNWPLPLYVALARRARDSGLQILFSGGPSDQTALEPAREAGFAVAAGAPLTMSAALARLSTLVLGGDSGLPHLATAMGKRVLMIMRSLRPGACHPFGHPEWAVVPSFGSPLATVTLAEVCQRCAEALAQIGINGPAGRLAAEDLIAV